MKMPEETDDKMPLDIEVFSKTYMGSVAGNSDEMWLLNFEEKGRRNNLADFGWSKVSPTLQQTCVIALENSSNCEQRTTKFEKEALKFFAKRTFKWTLEPEIPEHVPPLPSKGKSPNQVQRNKSKRNLTIMKRMIECANQKLAKDGSMTKEDVRALLDATSQIVNDTSKALKGRNTGKRKQDNNDKAESSEHLDVNGGAEFADMDINELKDNMVLDSEG